MSSLERIHQAPAERPEPAKRPLAGVWFGWWVAFCLAVLAWSTQQQLAAQERILEGSRKLEATVAEAAEVSRATNDQLAKVSDLDQVTTELGSKLQQLGQINVRLKGELLGLEQLVIGLEGSVAQLDQQALSSHEALTAIAVQSERLHRTMQRSFRTSQQVAGHLNRMVLLQERVNAELAEMNRKTRLLDRLPGGG